MAANHNGLDSTSVIVDDYIPPTPAERGDFVDEDDAPADEPEEELDEPEEDAPEEDEPEEDAPEEDAPEEDAPEEDAPEEDAPEEDAPEEDAPEEKPAKGKNKRQVPLDRLNKEISKRRALETQLAELRKAPEVAPPETKAPEPEATGISREEFEGMQEAMLDGETDKAFEIFGKMMNSQNQAVQSLTEKDVADRVRSEINQDRATAELVKTATDLSVQYPELDSAGDDSDDGLIEEVVEMRDLYVERGLSPSDALKKSVRLVALENGLKDRTAKPKADMAKPAKRLNSKAKLDAAKKERGKLGGSGGSSRPKVDISRLGDEEFGKLSKEALATARGDYIA